MWIYCSLGSLGFRRGGKFSIEGMGAMLASISTISTGMSCGVRLLVGVEAQGGVVMGEIGVCRERFSVGGGASSLELVDGGGKAGLCLAWAIRPFSAVFTA